jgi:hypothetical protein
MWKCLLCLALDMECAQDLTLKVEEQQLGYSLRVAMYPCLRGGSAGNPTTRRDRETGYSTVEAE